MKEYELTKVIWITEGGSTGHDSIRNGVFFLKDKIQPEDFVIVHDAVDMTSAYRGTFIL